MRDMSREVKERESFIYLQNNYRVVKRKVTET